ncbi:MAG: hypothetical protein JSV97_04820 [candidate division WOR-3 bacterium]|nr:MAG: hypothetical protein JSV97_04820 [candidate division WOR-3 bacterium]
MIPCLINYLDIIGLALSAIGTIILIFIRWPPSLTYVKRKKDGANGFEWELPDEDSPQAQEELRKRYNMQESFKRRVRRALIFILTGFILQGIYIYLNKL